MSVQMRWEQCCSTPGCTKPAHHGSLCAACFLAAPPSRRAVELIGGQPETAAEPLDGYVSEDGITWLEQLWAA
jgi:hypothetical protein